MEQIQKKRDGGVNEDREIRRKGALYLHAHVSGLSYYYYYHVFPTVLSAVLQMIQGHECIEMCVNTSFQNSSLVQCMQFFHRLSVFACTVSTTGTLQSNSESFKQMGTGSTFA